VLPELLSRLGCNAIGYLDTPSPEPAREAEPRARNLGPTAQQVTAHKCDLGIATDIDADRVLFIDEQGNILSEDVVGAIFAEDIFQGSDNKNMVSPINSSALNELICQELGVNITYCKPGQPDTVDKIKKVNAIYSYEESGKYYFCEHVLWCDGLLTAAKLLELMARTDLKLSQLAARFPPFYQVKHIVPCRDEDKPDVMAEVRKLWQDTLLEGRLRDITISGLKRIFDDHSWLLIRPSGTEPIIRVYSDAQTPERAHQLVTAGEELLARAMQMVRKGTWAQREHNGTASR
jgi:phosphomannomutase/phosphoglucomutase